MQAKWTQDFLGRRIDRCYLVAAWTRIAEKRETYLRLARHYRGILAAMPNRSLVPEPA